MSERKHVLIGEWQKRDGVVVTRKEVTRPMVEWQTPEQIHARQVELFGPGGSQEVCR